MEDPTPDSIVIFTKDKPESVIAANGSGSWRVNVEKWAGAIDWLILTNKIGDTRQITLVGRVVGFEPDTAGKNPGRYAIKIDAYALMDDADLTFSSKSTNPVQFRRALDVLGFDPKAREMTPVGEQKLRQSYESRESASQRLSAKPLSIAEAKEGLAVSFGISPEQVEITIRA